MQREKEEPLLLFGVYKRAFENWVCFGLFWCLCMLRWDHFGVILLVLLWVSIACWDLVGTWPRFLPSLPESKKALGKVTKPLAFQWGSHAKFPVETLKSTLLSC